MQKSSNMIILETGDGMMGIKLDWIRRRFKARRR